MKKILIVAAAMAFTAAAHAGDPAAGKEKAKLCAACHGETGASPIADNPKLAGQYYQYLLRALNERAGIYHDYVGIAGIVRNFCPSTREQTHHHLAIDEVLRATQAHESDFLRFRRFGRRVRLRRGKGRGTQDL